MAEDKNITERMAANILGVTEQALDALHDLGVDPNLAPPEFRHPNLLSYILKFTNELGNPNILIPPGETRPHFAKHDDGRWWLIRRREQAERRGSHRYFTGERIGNSNQRAQADP